MKCTERILEPVYEAVSKLSKTNVNRFGREIHWKHSKQIRATKCANLRCARFQCPKICFIWNQFKIKIKTRSKIQIQTNQNVNYVQLSMADLPKKIRYDKDDKFMACIRSIRGTSTDIERIFFFWQRDVSKTDHTQHKST